MANETKKNTVQHSVPQGYEEVGGDVAGFWDPEHNALHFIPRTVKLMDSSIDDEKVSALITGELLADTDLDVTEGNETAKKVVKKGALVGVWYKPGMRGLKNLAGAKVYIYADGAKDVGKGNPMRTFKVNSPVKSGSLLPVESDTRVGSRGVNHDFAPAKGGDVQFDHSDAS